MDQERVKRLKPTYPNIDLTKPVDLSQIMPVDENDCFGRQWKPDHKFCAVCADNEMCGIKYNALQTKQVKKLEKEKDGYLDNMHFDSIDHDDLKTWLKMKPRTTTEFIDKVARFSKCPDRTTVEYWCRSFVVETRGVSTKGGIVIVK